MNYGDYVQSFQGLYLSARGAKEPVLPPLLDAFGERLKRILIIAPHPDDECLMSGFALRAQDEWGTEVYVLPYSFGSKLDRQHERKRELSHAVDALKFTLVDPRAPLFQELNSDLIEETLKSLHPDALMIPHLTDGHPTHVHCAELAMKAAHIWAKDHPGFHVFETEYWSSVTKPTHLIPLSADHLIRLGEALLEHKGELARNPYHLSLPANAMEQMRRGSEAVLGMGSKSREFIFGQILRHTRLVG